MVTKEEITVNPKSSINIELKDSKGRFDRILDLAGIVISAVTLIAVTVMGLCTFLLDERVEETKQLNRYLDKVANIITKNSKIQKINYRVTYSLDSVGIKQIDQLTSAYTRNLNPKSRGIILIYLYESGLINHTKAQPNTTIGVEGKCAKNSSFYCNLSTERYYFNDVNLSGLFLQDIKLHYSNLNGVNFTNTSLSGAKFNGSGLRAANFTDADLRKANFSSPNTSNERTMTILRGANFHNADLKKANFKDADLSKFNQKDCEKTNDAPLYNFLMDNFPDDDVYKFKKESCNKNNNFRVTNFTDAKLMEANFTGAKLMEADLTKADLTKADLTRANLTNANLENTVFKDAHLDCADLTGATKINTDEIKKASNWWTAKYDTEMEKKLELLEWQKERRSSYCNNES